MSHDMPFNESLCSYASQLTIDKFYDYTKFNFTLTDRSSIGNQNDDSFCLKAVNDDFDSIQVNDDKADRIINFGARNESGYIQRDADDSNRIKQNDNDHFLVFNDDYNVIKINDHKIDQSKSNNILIILKQL